MAIFSQFEKVKNTTLFCRDWLAVHLFVWSNPAPNTHGQLHETLYLSVFLPPKNYCIWENSSLSKVWPKNW
jgi:hypothetical protein